MHTNSLPINDWLSQSIQTLCNLKHACLSANFVYVHVMWLQLLCRYEQANLDTLKRERDYWTCELKDLATKNKVSERAKRGLKESVPVLQPLFTFNL